jgi:hypothetical protein
MYPTWSDHIFLQSHTRHDFRKNKIMGLNARVLNYLQLVSEILRIPRIIQRRNVIFKPLKTGINMHYS